jgi:phosphatidylinositol glycan class C protein
MRRYLRICAISDGLGRSNGPTGILAELDVLVRTAVGLAVTLAALSPVLRSLTNSYSDDTVATLVAACCLVHLFAHDYSDAPNSSGAGIVSLNAGVFAAVLLASRLSSEHFVYELFVAAVLTFAGAPFLRKSLQRSHLGRRVLLGATPPMAVAAWWLLSERVDAMLARVYAVAVVFVVFVCPLAFVHAQRYKTVIHGPWDIAHIDGD